MADPPRLPDSEGDSGMGPDRGPTAGTPRWVKVFGIITIAVVLLFAILLLSGRGHGPGRHLSGALAGPSSFGGVAAGSADGPAPSAGGRG